MNRLFVTFHFPDTFTDQEAKAVSDRIHTATKKVLSEIDKEGIQYYGTLRKTESSRKVDVEYSSDEV